MVGLGVGGAVPVEVVPTGPPAVATVLTDAHLGVGRLVGPGHRPVLAPHRQLPADVGLGLQEVPALAERQQVQRAALAGRESGSVQEDAGAVDHPGLAPGQLALRDVVRVLELDPAAGLGRTLVLPLAALELLGRPGHPLLVLVVSEVRTERAAPVVGPVGVDARTPLTENAGPAGREPGQVAAEDLVGVVRVDELGERTGERQQDFRHPCSLWRGHRSSRSDDRAWVAEV